MDHFAKWPQTLSQVTKRTKLERHNKIVDDDPLDWIGQQQPRSAWLVSVRWELGHDRHSAPGVEKPRTEPNSRQSPTFLLHPNSYRAGHMLLVMFGAG